MREKHFSKAFRREAVKQIVELGHPVHEVSERLRVSTQSLFKWLEDHQVEHAESEQLELEALRRENAHLAEELHKLRKELALLKSQQANPDYPESSGQRKRS